MAIKQGTLSSFPLPSPVKAQVANPTAGGNPLNLIDPNGNELQVVDFQGLRYSLRLMQDAINKLENPPASSVSATPSLANIQLQANQSGSVITNATAVGAIQVILPPAETQNPPLTFSAYIVVAHKLSFVATGGAKILLAATSSSANGTVFDSTVGDGITLTCISTNVWAAHPISGSGWAAT